MMKSTDNFEQLQSELKNFQEIAQHIMPAPGEIPTLKGIEVYGGTIPLNGTVGGDHIIYVDFKNRQQRTIKDSGAWYAKVIAANRVL